MFGADLSVWLIKETGPSYERTPSRQQLFRHLCIVGRLAPGYTSRVSKQRLASLDELPEGGTAKFEFVHDGIRFNGFVARVRGQVVAYENLCRHLPLALDGGDHGFFTPDGRCFVCRNHGAIFEPLTGLCVRGPCQGARLKPLPIEVADGAIWLTDAGSAG
ncbi:MAG: Rieske 2Fe-2S domain-containing protein [Verrucomicrobia bacterium]|nr:Rieske 2Fe-2S domain-containing protein [Verrucomicrobiota bacterium]